MPTAIIWANFAKTVLALPVGPSDTSATLAPGTGSYFPQPATGQYFTGVFNDITTGLLNEVVHVTAVTGDVITIVRAQEGTTALPWAAGDKFGNLITAGSLANINSGQAAITPETTAGNITYTPAQFLAGVINRSGPVADYSDTTPAAAALVAAIPFVQVGSSFRLRVLNTTASQQALLPGAGVTLVGATTLYGSTWQDFLGVVTDVNTPAITVTAIGSGVVSS